MNNVPLEAFVGADFYLPIVWNVNFNGCCYPMDLSGYSAHMQVRQTVNSVGAPLVDISTGNGNIVINGPTGQISLYIPNNITANFPEGCYVYDLLVINSVGMIERLFGGSFKVKGLVTQ